MTTFWALAEQIRTFIFKLILIMASVIRQILFISPGVSHVRVAVRSEDKRIPTPVNTVSVLSKREGREPSGEARRVQDPSFLP